MKRLALTAGIAVVLVVGLWLVAMPGALLQGWIEGAAGGQERLVVDGLRKGLFFNFHIDRLSLVKSAAPLLEVEDIDAEIDPLSLLLLRVNVRFSGAVSGGRIDGTFVLGRGRNSIEATVGNADLGSMPFLASLGITGHGSLSGDAKFTDGTGEVLFTVRHAKLTAASFSGITVPLDLFSTARGAMASEGGRVTVRSFTMEGEGIYARVKGSIAQGLISLTLELMPQREFMEKNPVFSLLQRYRVTPGYYVVPVNRQFSF